MSCLSHTKEVCKALLHVSRIFLWWHLHYLQSWKVHKADEKGRYDCSENSWYRSVASSCILRQVKSTLSEKSFSLSFRAVNSKLSIIVPPLFLLSIYEIISEFHSWEVFRHGHHSHTFFRMHFVGFMECRPNLTSRLSLSTALCLSVKPVNSVLSFAFLDLRPSRQWFVEK